MESPNWSELCREYRRRLGLKQEAMAQDFGVDQSLVSRWERGTREPPLNVKRLIHNALIADGGAAIDQSLQMLLSLSGSAVAIWDSDGVLHGTSPRFATEMREATGLEQVHGVSGHEFLRGHSIMDASLAVMREHGFFRGQISMVTARFAPFLRPSRQALGGVVTTTIFPVQLGPGEPAMLCIYDHDVLGTPPQQPDILELSWVRASDGYIGSAEARIGQTTTSEEK